MPTARDILVSLTVLVCACGGSTASPGDGAGASSGGAAGTGGAQSTGGSAAAGAQNTGAATATGGGGALLGGSGGFATATGGFAGVTNVAPDGGGAADAKASSDSPDATADRSTDVAVDVVGDSPSDRANEPAICPEPAAECMAGTHLGSVADLVAVVSKLPWQNVSVATVGPLSLSQDLVADVDLEVTPSHFTPPDGCADTDATLVPRCVGLRLRDHAFPQQYPTALRDVPGMRCAQPDAANQWPHSCSSISIAKGTTFRVRAVVQDLHPVSFTPFIEFERGCAAPCAADETRCPANQTCFGRGYAFCAFCVVLPAAQCACYAGCGGAVADGTTCFYALSPDVEVDGTCAAGSCVRTP
jgi:hypothetical protein